MAETKQHCRTIILQFKKKIVFICSFKKDVLSTFCVPGCFSLFYSWEGRVELNNPFVLIEKKKDHFVRAVGFRGE